MPSGPKTNKYTNRHAEEARQRDAERDANAKAARQKAKEDAEWAETDKTALKRLERQREEERKAAERAAREAEKKEQLQQEEAELNNKAPAHVQKRLRQKDLAKMLANYDKEQRAIRSTGASAFADEPKKNDTTVVPLETQPELPSTNPNKAKGVQGFEDEATGATVSASGSAGQVVESVERQLAGGGAGANAAAVPDNRHIGKRAKVLYKAFCAEHLEAIKEEHPNLRRTQYNDLLWERWQKSPQNPFVLRSEAADRARLEEERRWMEGDLSGEDEEEEEAPTTAAA